MSDSNPLSKTSLIIGMSRDVATTAANVVSLQSSVEEVKSSIRRVVDWNIEQDKRINEVEKKAIPCDDHDERLKALEETKSEVVAAWKFGHYLKASGVGTALIAAWEAIKSYFSAHPPPSLPHP